jgi:segregation and condensation protein B
MSDQPSPPPLDRIVEALLFVGGPPLTAEGACAVVHGLTPARFHEAAARLNLAYRAQGRPYRILPRGGGLEMVLRPAFLALKGRLHGAAREARLSQAALDTLSLVAFRQPVTRKEVDALRGADSLPQLRQLVRLGLIAVRGGEEAAYTTTRRFLETLGIESIEDLPRAEDE